jgi:hypothetical protein
MCDCVLGGNGDTPDNLWLRIPVDDFLHERSNAPARGRKLDLGLGESALVCGGKMVFQLSISGWPIPAMFRSLVEFKRQRGSPPE